MRKLLSVCAILAVCASALFVAQAAPVEDAPFVQFVSNRFAFDNTGLPQEAGRWPVIPQLPTRIKKIFSSTASLAPCVSGEDKCYSFTPRRNQICDLFRRGSHGKDGAWYSDSVQTFCLDLVNDGRSVYMITEDDAYLYDQSFERMISVQELLGVRLSDADVIELSTVHEPDAKRFTFELFTFADNNGKPNTITQCMIATSKFSLVDCVTAEDGSLGKIHSISCSLGGRACVIGADGGLFALERITDASTETSTLKLTNVRPEGSSTNAEAVKGPVYQVAIRGFVSNGEAYKKSTPYKFDGNACTVDIAYTTANALVRPQTRLSFGSVCQHGGRSVYSPPRVHTENSPLWRHEWFGTFQQGNDKNEVAQRGLAFTPEGSLYFATGDAVYRQASRTSASAPMAIQRISSLEGLPYNNTASISTAPYLISAKGAKNRDVGSQLYTANVGYFATPRGLTVIEKPNALVDNQNCRDAAFEGYDVDEFCPKPPSDFASDNDIAPRTFRWMAGPRWLPNTGFDDPEGNSILSISTSYFGRSTWVLLKTGLARIDYLDDFKLQHKADVIQGQIYPRHSRLGLVGPASLGTFGNLESGESVASDNDGLWTSIYLASQALKLAKNPDDGDAKENVNENLKALENLIDVTGIRGLMARTFKFVNQSEPADNWYESTTLRGYRWKGDTSSDEVVGHMFVYSLLSYLFPIDGPSNSMYGRIAQRRLTEVMEHILKNDYQLIDITGRPTTWGVWNPANLNSNPFYFDGRGVNSAQILAYLNAAASFADQGSIPNSKVIGHINKLINEHSYDQNMVNLKVQIPEDNNFSDDELTFLPYATWRFAEKARGGRSPMPEAAQRMFNVSFDRTWKSVEGERPSLWTFIRGIHVGNAKMDQDAINKAVESLRRFPIELVNWPFDNTLRNDVVLSPYTGRDNTVPRLRKPVPSDESMATKWNADWYVARGGNGLQEADGGVFLLPFYLGRFFGFVN